MEMVYGGKEWGVGEKGGKKDERQTQKPLKGEGEMW